MGSFDLTGKVALVTGGNSGLGLGMAMALAENGADIAIWGTNVDKNEHAAAELSATGRRVLALRCDVGDHEAVGQAMGRRSTRSSRRRARLLRASKRVSTTGRPKAGINAMMKGSADEPADLTGTHSPP